LAHNSQIFTDYVGEYVMKFTIIWLSYGEDKVNTCLRHCVLYA